MPTAFMEYLKKPVDLKSPKTMVKLVGTIILLLALPLTVYVSLQQRGLRSQATGSAELKDSSGFYDVLSFPGQPIPDGSSAGENDELNNPLVSGYVLDLSWDSLENDYDNDYNWSTIENRMNEIRGKQNWRDVQNQKKLAIRIKGGVRVPMWLVDQKQGNTSFTYDSVIQTGTLTDTGANFSPAGDPKCFSTNLAGRFLRVDGQQPGVEILSSTANTLTIQGPWPDGVPDAGKSYAVSGCKNDLGVYMVNYYKSSAGVDDPPRKYAMPAPSDPVMLAKVRELLGALAARYDNNNDDGPGGNPDGALISRINPGGPNGELTEPYLTNSIKTENTTIASWLGPQRVYTEENVANAWISIVQAYYDNFNQTPFSLFYSDMPSNGSGRDCVGVSEAIHNYAKDPVRLTTKPAGFYTMGGNYLTTKHPPPDLVTMIPELPDDCYENKIWIMARDFQTISRSGWQIGGQKLSQEGGATSNNMDIILNRAIGINTLWLEIWPNMADKNIAVVYDKLNQYKGSFVVTPPDTSSPTVSISDPANGETVSGIVSVAATATDNVGVTRVEFYYDSTHLIGTDITATGNSYSVSWDTTSGVSNGSHTLIAKAYDAAGNSGTSPPIPVTVNNVQGKVGDLDSDGDVDIYDLSILLTRWGSSDSTADLNHNGTVDIYDLSALISHWGT